MDSSSRNAATVHEALKIIRDALAPFLLECLNEKHPSQPQWWDAVDLSRQGEESRVLPRNPLDWLPDETLKTMDDHWGAFSRKTKRRFVSPREKPAADEVPQGWVKHLREFRNRTMHQDDITDADLDDFLRVTSWLLMAARVDEAVQKKIRTLGQALQPNYTHGAASGIPRERYSNDDGHIPLSGKTGTGEAADSEIVRRRRINLGPKNSITNACDGLGAKYPVGSRLRGRISQISSAGAFVELEPGVRGSLHVGRN